MAPASITSEGRVEITLDENTRAIADLAARTAVKEHMASCPIFSEFREMHEDMYGKRGEKDNHPGVVGHVQSLLKSRRSVYKILAVLGSILAALAGALAQKLL